MDAELPLRITPRNPLNDPVVPLNPLHFSEVEMES